jgi:hypothetical protein
MLTRPLHRQSDGMVERYIKTAEDRLGRGITPLPPSLQGILSRHYGFDTS